MSWRLLLIIAGLWIYTTYKVWQMIPAHLIASGIYTLLLFVVMIHWILIYHSNPHLVNKKWFRGLTWLGSLTMGVWATFMLLSIPIDFGFLIYKFLVSLKQNYADPAVSGTLLMQQIDVTLLGISLCLCIIGFVQATRKSQVKSVSIKHADLPDGLSQFRIAQISDLHVGPTIRQEYVAAVVQRTNATNPDVIFVTGDLADAHPSAITKHLQPLSQLKAPLGVFYVTGNHEYYWNAEDWIKAVSSLGFITLLNENRIIEVKGATLLIAGVTDEVGGHFIPGHDTDLVKALQSQATADFKILLAHRPDQCFPAEKHGVHIQFSGHTHGGQFFPFNMLLPIAYKYYRNLHRVGDLWLYVNAGTGYWGPANRFGIPAEITLAILEKG